MSDTTVPAAEIGLPDCHHPSRGFARIPQNLTLEQEWRIHFDTTIRSIKRMDEIADEIDRERAAAGLPPLGLRKLQVGEIDKVAALRAAGPGPWRRPQAVSDAAPAPTMFPTTIVSVVRMPDGTMTVTTPPAGCGDEGGPDAA